MIRTSPGHDDDAAFDDAGGVVPSVGFDFDAVDGVAPNDAPIRERFDEIERLKIVRAVLAMLQATTNDAQEIGRRVQVFSHLLTQRESQRALAKRMNLTPGRVTQIKHELLKEFSAFSQFLLRQQKNN